MKHLAVDTLTSRSQAHTRISCRERGGEQIRRGDEMHMCVRHKNWGTPLTRPNIIGNMYRTPTGIAVSNPSSRSMLPRRARGRCVPSWCRLSSRSASLPSCHAENDPSTLLPSILRCQTTNQQIALSGSLPYALPCPFRGMYGQRPNTKGNYVPQGRSLCSFSELIY